MPKLPRLLIASVSDQEGPSACTLAMMAALRGRGYHVQHFRSLAAFTPIDYVTPLTGLASRHLDPWIMSGPLCRELFVKNASQADFSVIEGCTGKAAEHSPVTGGNGWRDVAETLSTPVVGVICGQPSVPFHVSPLPAGIDGLLVDGLASPKQFEATKTTLQEICGIPVLGGLTTGQAASECIEKMRRGRRVSGAIINDLARRLLELTDLDRVIALAHSRPFPTHESVLFAEQAPRRSLRVAIAYDDCFHCYFPDTLDALEFLGAELCEFSPLLNDRLPENTDIVYLGCGHPQDHARSLAANECMRAALREHVCAGQRIYAEGGGAAYLCRQIRLPDGSAVPMVGIFGAEAQFTGRPLEHPQPVELTCQRPSWIADPGETVRGYRNGAWRLVPGPGLTPCFSSDSAEPECVVRHHCVGSTIHLNFAAQPRVLDSFFAPHAPSLSI